MKKVEIEGRWFLSERTTCLGCGKRFSYVLPPEALYYWSRLCGKCDPTMPEKRPRRNADFEFWMEPMPMSMPWD